MKPYALLGLILLVGSVLTLLTGCPASNSPAAPAAPTDTPVNTNTSTATRTPTQTSTSTPTFTPSSTPSFTPTATVTHTPGPLLFENFDGGPWSNLPSNSYMCGNQTGWNGSTGTFLQSTTNHSGGYSLQATFTGTAAWAYGYLGFYSGFAPGWGAPMDVRINGSAPGSLSLWVYSAQATAVFLGLWSTTPSNSTYTTSLASTGVAATTWTNITVPLSGGSWDGNFAAVNWATITYVLVGPNDLTGAANSFTFNVDDVYFLP